MMSVEIANNMISSRNMLLLIGMWLATEIIFYVAIHILSISVNKLTPPAEYKTCPEKLVFRILDNVDNMKSYDIYTFFTGWFMGADLRREVYHGNFQSFLAWVMFAKPFGYLEEDEILKLEKMATHIYERMLWQPKSGFNSNVRHVGMTLEEISFTHRPLFIYVFVYLKNAVTSIIFHLLGFQSRQSNSIHYWYREGPSPNLEPIVFFHGITTGWGVYYGLIHAMSSNRAIFLIDFEAIKIFSLCFDFVTPEEYSTCVREILDHHHIKKVNIIGHSFGTITAAWFISHCADYVAHLTLVDPVSLLLAHPDVAFNFLYRPPSNFIEWVIYYGASQEITIANCLRRNFWWYNNVLWLEDIPSSIGVHVSLAGADQISSTKTIQEYIISCGRARHEKLLNSPNEAGNMKCTKVSDINYSIRDGHSHAQILACPRSLRELSCLIELEYKKIV